MSKNSSFRRPFDKQQSTAQKTVEFRITPPLPYLLFTVKAIDLKKMPISDMRSLKNVC